MLLLVFVSMTPRNGSKGKINKIERILFPFAKFEELEEFEEDDNKFSTGEKRIYLEYERAKMKRRERTDIAERG